MGEDHGAIVRWLGHACIEVASAQGNVLVDPWILENPSCPIWTTAELERELSPDRTVAIAVSHAHRDHLGDAVEISKMLDVPIVSIYELCEVLSETYGVRTEGLNLGGSVDFQGLRITLVPAMHTSSYRYLRPDDADRNAALQFAGAPTGVVVRAPDGQTIYHAGDTAVFGDMELIERLYNPDVCCLPVGGRYTMDLEQAVLAMEWFPGKKMLPIHYNTFEAISVDRHEFESIFQRQLGFELYTLEPGERLIV